ncbi:hypothetical protein [Nonomuraea deserti]|uniref:hypothetical protein n=1 Tax=Nonomuraea deserti TaxID=1848322 RepID=UPI0034E0C090
MAGGEQRERGGDLMSSSTKAASGVGAITGDGVGDLDGEARLARLGEDGADLFGSFGEHPGQLARPGKAHAAGCDQVEQLGTETAGRAVAQRGGGSVSG